MSRQYKGVESNNEFDPRKLREDMRSLPQKLRDSWMTPSGQQTTLMLMLGAGFLLLWAPLGAEFIALMVFAFVRIKLQYHKQGWDFPFRVPISAKLKDASMNDKMGAGLEYLGSEVSNGMPVFASDNDARTHGLFFGTTGSGKAQPLDAIIHTPSGPRTMGSIVVGDYVVAVDGSPSRVLGVFPQGVLDIYRVTLEDGRSTEVCGEHLWEVWQESEVGQSKPRVLRTVDLLADLEQGKAVNYLPLSFPVQKPRVRLALHPYLLGVLLADRAKAASSWPSDDDAMVTVGQQLRATGAGTSVHSICSILHELGIEAGVETFLPDPYLQGDLDQRSMLLHGLCGIADATGEVSFDCVSAKLAAGVRELAWSLGGIATLEEIGGAWRVQMSFPQAQHANMLLRAPVAATCKPWRERHIAGLRVIGVARAGKKEAKCIYIDHPRHLYVTDQYIVTHNTEMLMAFVVNSMVYDGGSSYTDGKGDIKLWFKFMNAARMFGKEDDLLLISFITSGKEFYDRQETLPSNTLNPYAVGSSGMCTEASIALMDGGGGDDMWKGRAIAFLGGLIKPLVFLRDKGEVLLGSDYIRQYFDLPMLERFVYDKEDAWGDGGRRPDGYFLKTYGRVWQKVIRPLQAFMVTIPGYNQANIGKQEQKTLEQHGYITMQLARLFGDLADNYGHIMDTPLGQVDFYDVVINNRILVTLLPALERSPESLGMLGKIIVGGIKQMAAGCLGNRVEGLRREIVDARPTNAPVPFPTIFDEYGYYVVLGFASMPAQARSLGFQVIFAAQDFASLKKSSVEEADQTWENTNIRGIGRIVSGSDAETYTRMSGLGGTVRVAELSGYERVPSMLGFKIRAGDRVEIKDVPRVSSDDLHSQADGEFHLFLGKKTKEGNTTSGGVRIARVMAFYTDVAVKDKNNQPVVNQLALNHFGRVQPPSRVVESATHASIVGKSPTSLLSVMRKGSLTSMLVGSETMAPRTTEIIQIDSLNRSLGVGRHGRLEAAMLAVPFMAVGNRCRMQRHEKVMQLTRQGFSSVSGTNLGIGGLGGGKPPVVPPAPASTAGGGTRAAAALAAKAAEAAKAAAAPMASPAQAPAPAPALPVAPASGSTASVAAIPAPAIATQPSPAAALPVAAVAAPVSALVDAQSTAESVNALRSPDTPEGMSLSLAKAMQVRDRKVEVPVQDSSFENVRGLVEEAGAAGLRPVSDDADEATRAARQSGAVELTMVNPLKDRKEMEQALLDASQQPMSQEQVDVIKERSYGMTVLLDNATSYIDDPTPHEHARRVEDVVKAATNLYSALCDKDAVWAVGSSLLGDSDEDEDEQ